MATPPEIPAFCLGAAAVRVDGDIKATLGGIESVLCLVGGTIAARHPYSLTVDVHQPDGRPVRVQVTALRVLGADYLEVGAAAGSVTSPTAALPSPARKVQEKAPEKKWYGSYSISAEKRHPAPYPRVHTHIHAHVCMYDFRHFYLPNARYVAPYVGRRRRPM